uniref:Uncharacterized protein n=1 Tax=Magallana gigas TaxID=29159 RepID=K1Q299_MAGGI
MSLTREVNRGEAVRETNVLGTAEEEQGNVGAGQMDPVSMARHEARGYDRGDQGASVLQARVGAIESQLAQITQLLVGMSGSLGGTRSRRPSPRDKAQDNLPPEAVVSSRSVGQGSVETGHPQ